MVFAAVKKDGAGNAARNKTQPKTLGRKKRHKTQNLADERRITGRFAKRFSGERPVSLGFELTFLSEFSELFGGCLTAPRSVALVYVKHPPKCHLGSSNYLSKSLILFNNFSLFLFFNSHSQILIIFQPLLDKNFVTSSSWALL